MYADGDSAWSYALPESGVVVSASSDDKNASSHVVDAAGVAVSRPVARGGDQDYLIIYNRVPKTGSTTFANIVYSLCGRRHFNVIYVRAEKNAHIYSIVDQVSLCDRCSSWV